MIGIIAKNRNDIKCLYGCEDSTVYDNGTMQTLVGWGSGKDPNHYTTYYQCSKCYKKFTEEWIPKYEEEVGRAIIDDNLKVIKGNPPGCCVSKYLLKCECGGWKGHSQRGKGTSYGNSKEGKWGPKQPMYWQCDTCQKKLPDERWGTEYMDKGIDE